MKKSWSKLVEECKRTFMKNKKRVSGALAVGMCFFLTIASLNLNSFAFEEQIIDLDAKQAETGEVAEGVNTVDATGAGALETISGLPDMSDNGIIPQVGALDETSADDKTSDDLSAEGAGDAATDTTSGNAESDKNVATDTNAATDTTSGDVESDKNDATDTNTVTDAADDAVAESVTEEIAVEEPAVEPFTKSVTTDGVVITVTADAGVFPEGATVSAVRVLASEEKAVEEVIDEVREENRNVAASYTFDITVFDSNGNEIEPDMTKGSVKVTFKMDEIANDNLETKVYHVEETASGLNAENLPVSNTDGEAVVETDGFSYYTVEFTYKDLQYVLEGYERVELSTILNAVEISENGSITSVVSSNDELFTPVFENNVWYIQAVRAFNTNECLKVTIDGIEYVIDVTDAVGGAWSELKLALNGTTTTTKAGLFEIEGSKIKLLTDFTAEADDSTLYVSGIKILDLNGHVINANGKNMRAITISVGSSLTLEDSSPAVSHEGYVDANGVWHLGTGSGTPLNINGGIITGGMANEAVNNNDATTGGGVLVYGSFTMDGGSISGNTLTNTNYSRGGAGVAVYNSNASFKMNGGNITYNRADNGGGVWVLTGSFDMYDGAVISNCRATASGGGTFVEKGAFNMHGGVIEDCEAENGTYGNGGGLFTHTDGAFTMTGGSIRNNIAAKNGAGVFRNQGTVTVGGTAQIIGNMSGTNPNNLYLPNGALVGISSTTPPETSMRIGVTMYTGTGNITAAGNAQYAQCFTADASTYTFYGQSDCIYLGAPTGNVFNVNTATTYSSIADAIAVAQIGETIRMLANLSENISVPSGKSIVLDLNGKVLTASSISGEVTINDSCASSAVHYFKYHKVNVWNLYDTATDAEKAGALTLEQLKETQNPAEDTIVKIKGAIISGSSSVTVSGNVTVNGGTVAGHYGSYGGGMVIDGQFTMNEGASVIGNYASTSGGAIYVNNGTFIMNGGLIAFNSARNDTGGVNIKQNANFKMMGGSIEYNYSAANIGALFQRGTAYIGGTAKIVNNHVAGNSGAIFSGGTLVIEGSAVISGNTSNEEGAAVYVTGGTTTIQGNAKITDNKTFNSVGGGVYVGGGTLTLGENVQIKGNTKGSGANEVDNNVYLPAGKTFMSGTGDKALSSGANIGFTTASTPTAGTGVEVMANGSNSDIQYLHSDVELNAQSGVVFGYEKTGGSTGHVLLMIPVAQIESGTSAGGYSKIQYAVAAAGNEPVKIKLVGDTEEYVDLKSGADVTLDLNGHTLKNSGGTGYDANVIWVENGAKLTVEDSSAGQTGQILRSNSGNGRCIHDDGTLTIKSGTLSSQSTNNAWEGGIVNVGSNAKFELQGGKLEKGYTNQYGGAVNVSNSGTFIMSGGTIENSKSTNGGGVFVYGNGTFNMSGGTIKNCQATYGAGARIAGVGSMTGGVISDSNAVNDAGGIFVASGGVFNMIGDAKIKDNSAGVSGGGIYTQTNSTFNLQGGEISGNKGNSTNSNYCGGGVLSLGTFNMSGGKITGNSAVNTRGGGVDVCGGTFVMSAGEITGNTAKTQGGGVFVGTTVATGIVLSGSAQITGNSIGAVTDNLYVPTGKKVTIGTPISDLNVGITVQSAPSAGNPTTFIESDVDYSDYLTSDNTDYAVKKVNGKNVVLTKEAINNTTPESSQDNNHGYIKVASSEVFPDEIVKVTVKPKSGYALKKLIYNDGTEDHDITSAKKFTMPYGPVTITAEFEPHKGGGSSPNPNPNPNPDGSGELPALYPILYPAPILRDPVIAPKKEPVTEQPSEVTEELTDKDVVTESDGKEEPVTGKEVESEVPDNSEETPAPEEIGEKKENGVVSPVCIGLTIFALLAIAGLIIFITSRRGKKE